MKLIALLMIRNEQWIISASLDAALRWCDGIAVYLDRCEDRTYSIVQETRARWPDKAWHINYDRTPAPHWAEMEKRDAMLQNGRALGGTHFALVDADELLTANILPSIRAWIDALVPGELLELPMVPVWRDLEHYRKDSSIWSSVWLTTAFADKPGMGWAPRGPEKYEYHNRPPHGHTRTIRQPCEGGVMHLQFADWRRLTGKHIFYRMSELVQWPGRRAVKELNEVYDMALDERGLHREPIPDAWWGDYRKEEIHLSEEPWHEQEIQDMIRRYGREAFAGLDLKGLA